VFEALQDRWEHMTPRERRLMALLGVAFVVCVFAFVGMMIQGGLDDIEAENELRRDALAALAKHRREQLRPKDGPQVEIRKEAVDLPTYLDGIAREVGIEIPNYNPQPTDARGAFNVISTNIDVRDVTVDELSSFLEKVETRDRTVVITSLSIERSFRKEDELRRAAMTVTTYERAKKKQGEGKDEG